MKDSWSLLAGVGLYFDKFNQLCANILWAFIKPRFNQPTEI